jgi:hypothetical protein
MSFLSREERMDQVIAKYMETKCGRRHWIEQVTHMRTVLSGLESVDWEDPGVLAEVAWPALLGLMEDMRAWNLAWRAGLVAKYERLKHQRVVQDASGGVSIGLLTGEQPDLRAREEQAFAHFVGDAHKWNADLMRHTQTFYQAVELYARTLEQKYVEGRQHAIIKYGNMQFTYIKLLQHVFDVPTIDDRDAMEYEAGKDPCLLQMSLQRDVTFIDLLLAAGEHVLWLDEDAMNQTTHYLPNLFHDMVSFYDYIHASLVHGYHADDEDDAGAGGAGGAADVEEGHAEWSPEREEDASQETQPMGELRSQMTCLLDQLQLVSIS